MVALERPQLRMGLPDSRQLLPDARRRLTLVGPSTMLILAIVPIISPL